MNRQIYNVLNVGKFFSPGQKFTPTLIKGKSSVTRNQVTMIEVESGNFVLPIFCSLYI